MHAFGTGSFQSLWYWVLTILLWTHVSHRVLGVPYDMVLRAPRLPEVDARVTMLAQLTSDRIGGLHDRAGALLSALIGFGLSMLLGLAVSTRSEVAVAAFVLVLPLAVVAYSTLRLALAVRRQRMAGPELRRALRKRRIWHTVIGLLAIGTAVSMASIWHRPLL